MAITIGLRDRGIQLAGKVDVGEPPSRILFRQHSSCLPAATPGVVLPSIAQAAALVSGHWSLGIAEDPIRYFALIIALS